MTTIEEWISQRSPDLLRDPNDRDGHGGGVNGSRDKRPLSSSGSSSSGLSSVGSDVQGVDDSGDIKMDLS